MKKKIGIFINSLDLSNNIRNFVELSENSKNYSIILLLIKNYKVKNNFLETNKFFFIYKLLTKFPSIILLKFINKIEEYILIKTHKFSKSFLKNKNIKYKFQVINLYPEFDENKNSLKFSEYDLQKIRKVNLDLLVQFGSTSFKGDILNICTNGIISLGTSDYNEIFNNI